MLKFVISYVVNTGGEMPTDLESKGGQGRGKVTKIRNTKNFKIYMN